MSKTVFLTIAGKTNAGKSSLLNALVGEKIASVSAKPQTTRTRITGIKTIGDTQMVFMDTPGLHKGKTKLSGYMMNAVRESVSGIDAAIFVMDCTKKLGDQETAMLESFVQDKVSVIFVINKIDLLEDKSRLAPLIAEVSVKYDPAAIVPISVLENSGIDDPVEAGGFAFGPGQSRSCEGLRQCDCRGSGCKVCPGIATDWPETTGCGRWRRSQSSTAGSIEWHGGETALSGFLSGTGILYR